MKLSVPSIDFKHLRRHAAFIAFNIGVICVFVFGVAPPIVGVLKDGADGIAQRQATLARYEAISAQESAVRDYVKQVKESNAHGDLLEGASSGIVAANLQARLKTLGETAGVTIRSIQALPAKNLGTTPLVGARIDLSGRLEAVHTFVRAIESGPPLLFVMSATLRQQSMAWRLPGDENPEMEAQFDVYGGSLQKDHS